MAPKADPFPPRNDRSVPAISTLEIRLGYGKNGVKVQAGMTKLPEGVKTFRQQYRRANGGRDWARYNDWESPEDQEGLRAAALDFLDDRGNGNHFWPQDETSPHHNDLVWLRHREKLLLLVMQYLYRYVHRRPENPKKKGRQPRPLGTPSSSRINRRQREPLFTTPTRSKGPNTPKSAPLSSKITFTTSDGHFDSSAENTPEPAVVTVTSPSAGPSARAGASFPADAPQPDVYEIPSDQEEDQEEPGDKEPENGSGPSQATENTPGFEYSESQRNDILDHFRVDFAEMIPNDNALGSSRFEADRDRRSQTIPSNTPLRAVRSVSARPRAPDAMMEDPIPEEPQMDESARIEPREEIASIQPHVPYRIIYSRHPYLAERNWIPSTGQKLSEMTLADFKATVPIDLDSGTGELGFVLYTLETQSQLVSMVDLVQEWQFDKMKENFTRKMKDPTPKSVKDARQMHFEIEIELMGSGRSSIPMSGSVPDSVAVRF